MDLLLYPNKRWKPEIQSSKFSEKFGYNDHSERYDISVCFNK